MQAGAAGQKETPTRGNAAAREEGKSSAAPAAVRDANGTSGRAIPARRQPTLRSPPKSLPQQEFTIR